jgi:hypothetical protein
VFAGHLPAAVTMQVSAIEAARGGRRFRVFSGGLATSAVWSATPSTSGARCIRRRRTGELRPYGNILLVKGTVNRLGGR